MRWLLLSDRAATNPLGGMTVVLTETGCRLAADGDEVHWVTGRLNESLPEEGEWNGLHVHSWLLAGSMGPGSLLRSRRETRLRVERLLAGGAIDSAIVHQPFTGLVAGPLLARRAVPAVYFFHSPWPEEFQLASDPPRSSRHPGTRLRALLESRALRHFEHTAVFSRFMAERLHHHHPRAASPVMITPGVDAERYQPVADRRAVRDELGWPVEGPVLFSLRRLVRRTGVDLLIDAFPQVLARHPGATLLIGGSGELREDFERRVSASGTTERVRFLGYVPDEVMPRALAAADLVVVPTRELEGLGLVTLEAFAAGTPVVGTPVGANPELLTPVDPALVAAEASVEALAERITDLLDRGAETLHHLGQRCRAEVEASYGWEKTVADLTRLLGAAP